MPVSDTVLGVLAGGLFTLAGYISGGLINYYRTQTEVKAEDRRLRAELSMERKVEALTNLHAELEECQRGLVEILDRVPYDGFGENGEIEEADQLIEEFEIAMDEASIYLSEEQHETVLDFFETLGEVNSSISGWAFETVEMRGGDMYHERRMSLIDGYEEVKEILQDEIREPIEELD
ncbi:hypothetical protein ATJ93_4208 [Halopiger aswanensis]|uniref:Uncharacterized protein n=2 Tax=Halopiger aswanensis TaxID=148449 RepID=A0A419VZG5_9EURY|nr:hypothetical protein ATJ93_4208 [Halopiger aswanensis]